MIRTILVDEFSGTPEDRYNIAVHASRRKPDFSIVEFTVGNKLIKENHIRFWEKERYFSFEFQKRSFYFELYDNPWYDRDGNPISFGKSPFSPVRFQGDDNTFYYDTLEFCTACLTFHVKPGSSLQGSKALKEQFVQGRYIYYGNGFYDPVEISLAIEETRKTPAITYTETCRRCIGPCGEKYTKASISERLMGDFRARSIEDHNNDIQDEINIIYSEIERLSNAKTIKKQLEREKKWAQARLEKLRERPVSSKTVSTFQMLATADAISKTNKKHSQK
jgi:hypothetical protein